MVMCRGVRGATVAEENTREAILDATRELLARLVAANDLQPDDVASIIFSVTPDLSAEFPAVAARQLGWNDVALLDTVELNVPGALARCIRVLIHWNTPRTAQEIVHIYLREAERLRPDRVARQG